MDYLESFAKLKTTNQFGKKAVYKAVLLLVVIEMFEDGILSGNEIKYSSELKKRFANMLGKVLRDTAALFPDAFVPFWYLQEESFWHIVPVRGKEYILEIMSNVRVRPSEEKLETCVSYAELDEDLYFLMTMASGRSSLKRVLLENYSELSDDSINEFSSSKKTYSENSLDAMAEYENIVSSTKINENTVSSNDDKENAELFNSLSDDLQLTLNIAYYSYLKSHRAEREVLRILWPNVCALYSDVYNKTVECSPAHVDVCVDFLTDLKITLMGEDSSSDLVGKIDGILEGLNGEEDIEINNEDNTPATDVVAHRQNMPWTDNEDELISLYHSNGLTYEEIASKVGRTADSIMKRLLNHKAMKIQVENTDSYCSILNSNGERVFRTTGKFKIINDIPYRLNYKSMCFTIKSMVCSNGVWSKGEKKIVAYEQSDLYKAITYDSYYNDVEDLKESMRFEGNCVKVKGVWYTFDGHIMQDNSMLVEDDDNSDSIFVPKGKLKSIDDIASSPYDYLWMISVLDILKDCGSLTISFDNVACMMIANAWGILRYYPYLADKDSLWDIKHCIAFLIKESKDYMDSELSYNSTSVVVYGAIKNYPMSGIFEETVDRMLVGTPYDILRLWIKSDNTDLIIDSLNFSNSCLYALHTDSSDPYIEINKNWSAYMLAEYENLRNYYISHFVEFVRKGK